MTRTFTDIATFAARAMGAVRARLTGGTMRSRRSIGGIVACVIALQGVGVSAAMGRGPAHVHVAPTPAAAVVLLDVRRSGFDAEPPAAASALSQLIGHHHDRLGRHFHAADDASVVVSAADQRIDRANGENGHALDLVVAAFMAIVTTVLLWLGVSAMRHGKASHTAWQPSLGIERRLDRPPQVR